MAKINSGPLESMLVRHPPPAASPTLDSSLRALIAHPHASSYRRSVRLSCARTLPNPPTADNVRFLDPLTGLDQPGSAPRSERGASGGYSSTRALYAYGARASEGGRPDRAEQLHVGVTR